MDKQIAKLKNKWITYEKFIKRTGSGDMSFNDPVSLHVFLFGKTETVYNANGEQVTTHNEMFIDGVDVVSLSPDDKFTIDGKLVHIESTSTFYHTDSTINFWGLYL